MLKLVRNAMVTLFQKGCFVMAPSQFQIRTVTITFNAVKFIASFTRIDYACE